MNEYRWYILFGVAVLMVLSLGLMNRYGRTLAPRLFTPSSAPSGIDDELPDRAPVLDDRDSSAIAQYSRGRKLSPPPDAMFDSPPLSQVAQGFQELAEISRAMSQASEISLASGVRSPSPRVSENASDSRPLPGKGTMP